MKFFIILFILFSSFNAFSGSLVDSTSAELRSAVAEKLAATVRFKTVSSFESDAFAYDEFTNLHAYLAEAFPLAHEHLQVEVINTYSLLFTWQGHNTTLKPVLFAAHMDVVPVESASEEDWLEQPFTGTVKDGYVWGRGTMDDKYRVVVMLEAVERLLQQGYSPERTLYLAFGHDEEVGGDEGAGKISELLQQRGVQLEAVFDEGLAVAEGVIPGIKEPLALVGTAAKGSLNLLLTVKGEGGHSSAPPFETPIGILSRAISRLHLNPFKPRLTSTTLESMEILTERMGGKYKFAMRHYGLFKNKILKKLAEDQATDVLIRTKLVPTIIAGGEKNNVLPRQATAVLNVRILNGETDQTVMDYVRRVIKDERVEVTRYGVYTPPSPETPTDTWVYGALKTSILHTFPDALVVPALFPGSTDARHYSSLTSNIFRFAPQVVDRESAQLVHNVNERIGVEVLEKSIDFYTTLMLNTCGRAASEHVADVEEGYLGRDAE